MKKKVLVSMFVLAAMLFSFAGCGAPAEKEDAPVSEIETPVAAEELVIGERSDSEDTFRVELTNMTGSVITGFTIKESAEEEYPDNMIPYGEIFEAESMRVLYFTPAEGAGEEAAPESEKETEAQYDAMITFEDGTVQEWLAIPFGDMTAGELLIEENVVYVTYVSVNSGEEINTLEAATQAVALKAEQAAAANGEPAKNDEKKPEANTGNKPSSGGNGGNGGGDNGCIGDGGLVYDDDNGGGSGGSGGGGNSGGGDDGCIGDDGLTY